MIVFRVSSHIFRFIDARVPDLLRYMLANI